MMKAVMKLKSLGAISECNVTKDQFISKIFLTLKPNGDKRFILNLKTLNKLIKSEHFKNGGLPNSMQIDTTRWIPCYHRLKRCVFPLRH